MRFLAILLFAGLLISGWFYLQEMRVKNRAQAWAAQLAARLPEQAASQDAAESAKKAEVNLYWILLYFDKLVTEGMDPGTVLNDACEQIHMPSAKSIVLSRTLMANYETAKKYRIFEEVTNVVKLEQGIAPLMKMSGWEDEPVTLGHIIPPHIAPEAAGAMANLTLMPAIVNDAQSGRVTASMIEQARAMERAQIITKSSLEQLLALAKQTSGDLR